MFDYKKEYYNSKKIINKYYLYLKHLKKNNKDINKFNDLFVSNIELFNYKVSNFKYNKDLYDYLYEIISKDNYNIRFNKIIDKVLEYQNDKYLSYNDVKNIKNIIFEICTIELSSMLDHDDNNVVIFNSRKEKKLLCIKNLLTSLLNISELELYSYMNKCEIELLKYDEFNRLSDNDKKIYRDSIINNSSTTEYDYLMSMINDGKYFGSKIIKKNNYYLIDNIIKILLFILVLLLNICFLNYLVLIISILGYKFIYSIITKIVDKTFIPKYNVMKNEKMLCMYYKTINNSDLLDKLFDEIEIISKDNTYDYGIFIECTSCDHQIEPFDDEITEKGMFLCKQLNEKYNTNRYHFVYRKRNKDFDINIWRGFDKFNGALKDIYDLIENNLSKEERDELFREYTYQYLKYDYLMIFNNVLEYNNLINNFGILLHPYNEDYNAITYGYNHYSDSLLYDSFIMKISDIEYAKGTNGVIVKKSYSIGNKEYNIENIYKNSTRLLINKRNINSIEYSSIINNVLSIICDITILVSLLMIIIGKIDTNYLYLFILLSLNYIYKLPINIFYKFKVLLFSLFFKNYKIDKLNLYYDNKVYLINLIYSIIICILSYIFKFSYIYLGIILLITNLYIIKLLIFNRRFK